MSNGNRYDVSDHHRYHLQLRMVPEVINQVNLDEVKGANPYEFTLKPNFPFPLWLDPETFDDIIVDQGAMMLSGHRREEYQSRFGVNLVSLKLATVKVYIPWLQQIVKSEVYTTPDLDDMVPEANMISPHFFFSNGAKEICLMKTTWDVKG